MALVTGAGRRLGRAIAVDLAQAGFTIAVHHHASSVDAADVVREVTEAGGAAAAFRADLSDAAGARSLAAAVLQDLGRVDVLVNSASIFAPTPIGALDGAAFDAVVRRLLGIHVAAPLALIDALSPALRATGRGAVVNVGDACTVRGDHAAYAASKAALASLTRTLARDLAPAVRVNMVAPGSILPPAAADADAEAELAERVPMGRLGTALEVAQLVRFLVCGSAFVTGQVVAVDGGQYA